MCLFYVNNIVTFLCVQRCDNHVIIGLQQTCEDNLVTCLIFPSITNLLTTSDRQCEPECEHNLLTAYMLKEGLRVDGLHVDRLRVDGLRVDGLHVERRLAC